MCRLSGLVLMLNYAIEHSYIVLLLFSCPLARSGCSCDYLFHRSISVTPVNAQVNVVTMKRCLFPSPQARPFLCHVKSFFCPKHRPVSPPSSFYSYSRSAFISSQNGPSSTPFKQNEVIKSSPWTNKQTCMINICVTDMWNKALSRE